MGAADKGRRAFLRGASTSLAAAGTATGFGMSAGLAHAARHEAVTQTKETQAAMTPAQALQMLKDGNARFLQGRPLQRDHLQQVKETGVPVSFRGHRWLHRLTRIRTFDLRPGHRGCVQRPCGWQLRQ